MILFPNHLVRKAIHIALPPKNWALVANLTLPSVRANAVQVLSQCRALMAAGWEVELIVPRRWYRHAEAGTMADLAADFGLDRLPKIRRLPCIDLVAWAHRLPPKLALAGFYIQHLSFLILAAAYLFCRRFQVVHTRETLFPLLGGRRLARRGGSLLLEIHDFPRRPAARKLLAGAAKRCTGLVVITRALKQSLAEAGITTPPVCLAPDGVAEAFFRDRGDKNELRQRLGLPDDGPLVMYSGGIYWAWKGLDTLIEAHRRLDDRVNLVIVGGGPRPEHLAELRAKLARLGLKRATAVGFVQPARVPDYLAAADVLVLPNSARAEISARFTSPLKLFEYLASGRPIVASNLPSLGEVLEHGRTAWLVEPDNPAALAEGVERLLADQALARRLAQAGRDEAQNYTWSRRAELLIGAAEGR